MNRILNSQAEFGKGAKTPEESFDRQILSGNYMMFLDCGLVLQEAYHYPCRRCLVGGMLCGLYGFLDFSAIKNGGNPTNPCFNYIFFTIFTP